MSLFVCGLASPPSLLPPRPAVAHNVASAKLSPSNQKGNTLLIRTETEDHLPHHQLLQQHEATATHSGERHAEEEPSSERSAAAAADALSPLSRRWLAQQERLARHRFLLDETEERNAIRCILALLCPTAAALPVPPSSSRTAAAASPLIPGKEYYQPVKGVVQLPRSMLKQHSTTTPSAAAAADPLPAPSAAGGAVHRPRPPPSKLAPPSLLRITTLEEAIAAKQQADAFYHQVPQALHCRAKKATRDVLEQRPLPYSSVHAASSLLRPVDDAAQSTVKAMGEERPPQQYTAKVGTVVRVGTVVTGTAEDNVDGSGGGESPYASQLQPLVVVACPTSDDDGTAAPLPHGETCNGINPLPRNQTHNHHDNKHNHYNNDVLSPSRQQPVVATRRPPPPLTQNAAARGGGGRRQHPHYQQQGEPNNHKSKAGPHYDGEDRSLLPFASEELGPAIDEDILRQYNQLTVRSGVLALLGAAAAQQARQKLKEEEEGEGGVGQEHKDTSGTNRSVDAAAAVVGCDDVYGDGDHDEDDQDGEVSEPQHGDVEEEGDEDYASMWGLDPPSGAVLQLLTNGPASPAARTSGKAKRGSPTAAKPTAPRQKVATLRTSPRRGGRPSPAQQEATSTTAAAVVALSSSPPPRSVGSPLPFWQRQLNLLTTHSNSNNNNNNNNNNNKIHRANSSVTSDPMSGGTPASSMTVSPSSRHASMTTLPPGLLPNSSASAALVDGHSHQVSGATAGGSYSSGGNGIHRRSLSSQQPQQQPPKTDEEVFHQFLTRLERQVQSWEGSGGEPSSSSKRRGSRRLTREGSLSHGAAAAAATGGGGGGLRSFDSFHGASPARKKSQGGAAGGVGGGAVFVGEDGMRWTSPQQQHYESGNVSTSSSFHRHHRATSFVM